MNTKRVLAVLMAIAMIAPLAACGSTAASSAAAPEAAASEAAASEAAAPEIGRAHV